MEDILAVLTGRDDNAAYDAAKNIAAESETSDKYYSLFDSFAGLMSYEKSYIRTRGFLLCCALARWDTEGKLERTFPQMASLIHDEKPTSVRQYLNALKNVVHYCPELCESIKAEVYSIDLTKYKDSMTRLIRKDADSLLVEISEQETNHGARVERSEARSGVHLLLSKNKVL